MSGVVERILSEEWLFAESHVVGSVVMRDDRWSISIIPLVGGWDSGSFVSGGISGLGMMSCFLRIFLGEGVVTLNVFWCFWMG